VDIHSSAFYYEAAQASKLRSLREPREVRSKNQPSAAQGVQTTDDSLGRFGAVRASAR